ncbi:MAG: prolipoprotein diacylglyceryl transferase [Acidimicrobiia bacterium]|nr:prolipoprotein diacylglyceryl transferase [Acidimicrobiia bacterium]
MIPYQTFPTFLGVFNTFGLMVGLGIVAGAWVAKRHIDANGEDGDLVFSFAWWAAIFGIVGARLVWVLAHPSTYLDDPLSVFALWEGGLSFFGGFLAAAPVAYVWLRRRPELSRRVFLDATSLGLVLGLGIGRIGCTSVGEHLGGETDFFLGVNYTGGRLTEPSLYSGTPDEVFIQPGMSFHNTAVYEFFVLMFLFVGLLVLRRRGVRPGVLAAVAGIVYAVLRFGLDFLRVNDNTTLGLTGAQFGCIVLLGLSLWWLRRVLTTDERRPDLAPEEAEDIVDDADAAEAEKTENTEENDRAEAEETEEAEEKGSGGGGRSVKA